MAELTNTECCAPAAQETCCEPTAKASCCGKGGCCHDKSQSAKAGSCCGNSCPRHGETHAGQ